jgi:hypothetical protein
MSRERWGTAGLVGLWLLAVVVFVASAPRGTTSVRIGQIVAGFAIVMAGMLLFMDWMGTATAMSKRSSSRWRRRIDTTESAVAATGNVRTSRIVAAWWMVFGALVVLFGVAGHS